MHMLVYRRALTIDTNSQRNIQALVVWKYEPYHQHFERFWGGQWGRFCRYQHLLREHQHLLRVGRVSLDDPTRLANKSGDKASKFKNSSIPYAPIPSAVVVLEWVQRVPSSTFSQGPIWSTREYWCPKKFRLKKKNAFGSLGMDLSA